MLSLKKCRCVEYGVLPVDEAEKIYKKVLKRKRGGGGAASSPAPSSAAKKKKKKAKLLADDAVDPDMQISKGEAVGRAVL